MGSAGTNDRRRGTPNRRRAFVGLAVALVLSSPFTTRAAAAEGDVPAESPSTSLEPSAQPCVPAPAPVTTDGSTRAPTSTTSADIAPDAAAPSDTDTGDAGAAAAPAPAPAPGCNGEQDTGGSPRATQDDCEDTGGSPTGAPRPQCPLQPKGSPDGPDDRLADCAGDPYQQSCADLVLALRAGCASSTWSPWCHSTAAGMLELCNDFGYWSTTPCEQVRPTLVRYCTEVPDADPARCPALAPSGGAGPEVAPATPSTGGPGDGGDPSGTGTGADSGASPRDTDGPQVEAAGKPGDAVRPRSVPDGAIRGGMRDLEPVDQPVSAPLGTPAARASGPTVAPKTSVAARAAEVVAKATAEPAADRTPTTLGVEGSVLAGSGGVTMALPAEPGLEGFAPGGPTLDEGDGTALDAFEPASSGESDRAASAQRSRDRWSLVPLCAALLLVMVSSAYDLRGRRRW